MEENQFESEDAHRLNTFSRKRQSMDNRATPLRIRLMMMRETQDQMPEQSDP